MQIPIVVNGRLVGPTHIELDEPVASLKGDVEVLLRVRQTPANASAETLSEFLRRIPPGTRSREDIDRQLRQERDSWEDDA